MKKRILTSFVIAIGAVGLSAQDKPYVKVIKVRPKPAQLVKINYKQTARDTAKHIQHVVYEQPTSSARLMQNILYQHPPVSNTFDNIIPSNKNIVLEPQSTPLMDTRDQKATLRRKYQ